MSKYGLNCYLDIIYCKDDFLEIFKILDLNSLKFIDFNNKNKETKYLHEVNAEDLEYIVNNIYNGKMVQNLSSKNSLWLKTFEVKLLKNISILNNSKLLFNYLILKLNSIGFDEEFSINYSKYIISLLTNNYISTQDLLQLKDKIDNIYKSKEYFIINNIGDFKKLEINLLESILTSKKMDNFNFDFRNFEKNIILQDQQSFSKHCFNQNKHLDFKLNKIYTLGLYKHLITNYLNEVLTLKDLQFDHVFLNKLTRFLYSVLNKVIDTWIY